MARLGFGLAALACAAAVMCAAPVRSADMPVPAYNPPPMPLPPARYNWTGIYFGGNVGAGLLDDSWTQLATTPASPFSFPGSLDVTPFGLVGGAQAGADVQFQSFVVGIQGSWSDSNITGNGLAPVTAGAASQIRGTSAPLWFASATGRVGYAANDWLFYAKGGGAWMSVKYTEDALINSITATTQSFSDTRNGFTAGAGIEVGLTEHFSAFLEYDFFDFGTRNYNFFLITPASIQSELHTLTFGLNYRFNPVGGWH